MLPERLLHQHGLYRTHIRNITFSALYYTLHNELLIYVTEICFHLESPLEERQNRF